MFDVDRELKAWSSRVLPAGCGQEDERRAELEDHLSCESKPCSGAGWGPSKHFTQPSIAWAIRLAWRRSSPRIEACCRRCVSLKEETR